jgi:uncharacterized protein (UPF0335 family)
MLCRDRVKVGMAIDVQKRLSGIQTSNPDLVTIAFFERVPKELAAEAESRAHETLRSSWVRGEWFDVTPERARAAVKAAIAGTLADVAGRVRDLSDAKVAYEKIVDIRRKSSGRTEAEAILEEYPDELADLTGQRSAWDKIGRR